MNLSPTSFARPSRPAGYGLALAVAFLPLALGTAACQQTRPQHPRPEGRAIEAVLQSERPTYRAGEAIRIRVALHNTADVPVSFAPYPPGSMVKLVITRQGAGDVEKRWDGGGGGTTGVTSTTLEPGQSWVLRADTTDWLPLNYWGYDLREPGHYTIAAIPIILGIEVVPDIRTVRSNRASFTITP